MGRRQVVACDCCQKEASNSTQEHFRPEGWGSIATTFDSATGIFTGAGLTRVRFEDLCDDCIAAAAEALLPRWKRR